MAPSLPGFTQSFKGGHFATLEQPERLAHETGELFRQLRSAR